MKKIIILLVLCLSMFSCTKTKQISQESPITTPNETTTTNNDDFTQGIYPNPLLGIYLEDENLSYTPKIESYKINDDFSNVLNYNNIEYYSKEVKEMLLKNHFAVVPSFYEEFFSLYESNLYTYEPSYITTDTMLHTFHLYYAHLQKNIEQTYLIDSLLELSNELLEESTNQLKELQGTSYEEAVNRNINFLKVGIALLNNETTDSDTALQELSKINHAQGLDVSPIFSTNENEYTQDYSQFKVRGYYTENENLGKYFKAMMWYGQMNFSQKDDDLNKSALLLTLALKDKTDNWKKIYNVTTFFTGESDDLTYIDYLSVIDKIYGNVININELPDKESEFNKFIENIKTLRAPNINSMVIGDETIDPDKEAATKGFRLLGQRFTLDAAIMNQLVYRQVEPDQNSQKRMLPTALDVPAALGSETALQIIKETSDAFNYPKYKENMDNLITNINKNDNIFKTSIYSGWLHTLRPLLKEKTEGYPVFMQSDLWNRKNLVTFLGSYAELKHDSILYAKQVYAQMGADDPKRPDDRGYVETEPEVFSRLSALAKATLNGLNFYNMISKKDAENMELLAEIADKLKVIAIKELENELPTDEEFDFIRSYGGQLEHFWLQTLSGDLDKYATPIKPSAIIADIATDVDDGTCLEIGTGKPSTIIVAVNFDGQIRLAFGSVYSFYEFKQPISNRLTDEEWQEMLNQGTPSMPEWTNEFTSE